MKTLLILRHAKSSWKEKTLADHDRPLNKRGQKDAPRMGWLIAEKNLLPDAVLSSTALRAQTTAEVAMEEADFRGVIEFPPGLYLAPPENYIHALNEVEDSANRVLVVGHNPGLEELLAQLTDQAEHLPTAALAEVELPIEHWQDLKRTTGGKLLHIWRPKEL